jgi:hypothetical protein
LAATLEAAGVEFTTGKRPGVRLRDDRLTGEQALAARKLLSLSQVDVARRARTNKDALGLFERRGYVSSALDLDRLRKVFETAGIEFPEGEPPQFREKRWDPPPPHK